ncbi:MAG: hypothetical protein ACJ79H_00725 [Myxococcales bacterium]
MAALAAAVLGSACGDPGRGNLEVNWTFAGNSCLAAGVQTIQVDIAHELLTPNQFSCDLGAGSIAGGANLGTYLAGQYTLTISGLDQDGLLLYQTRQDVAIHRGDNVLDVDVPRVPGGSVSLDWTFGGLTCAQAGVTSVRMSVDGALIMDQAGSLDVACSANGVDGTSISPLAPGTHRIDLVGLRSGVRSYWLQNVQVSVANRTDTNAHVSLPVGQPTSATADVSWDAIVSAGGFAPGTQGAMTCAEAQVDVVRIALDPSLDGSGGTFAGQVACDAAGVEGAQVSPIPAGTHSFSISAIRGSTVVYQTRHPASALFEPGLLSNVDVAADAVGSAAGQATLIWDFGTASVPCPIAYTLTDPNGNKQSASVCSQSVVVAGVSGLWSIDATAGAFQAQILFGVPNQASASWNIPFSR